MLDRRLVKSVKKLAVRDHEEGLMISTRYTSLCNDGYHEYAELYASDRHQLKRKAALTTTKWPEPIVF